MLTCIKPQGLASVWGISSASIGVAFAAGFAALEGLVEMPSVSGSVARP
ncbi:hypothetical protein [Comamonas testosteroni]